MAWKPLETRPHHVSGARGDSGADASHRTVQAWMGSNEKTAREGTPEPKKRQKSTANCRRKSIPNSRGKELTLLVIKHSAIEKIVKMPGVVECKVPTLQSSAETVTVPQVQFLTRMVDVPVQNNNENQ